MARGSELRAANGDEPAGGRRYPPTSLCLAYGVGTSGVSIVLNSVSVYFPALMTMVLGVPPAVAGTLMMATKIYDAFADVAIGAMSDRTRSRWGKRRPYLLVGAIVSALSLAMIFVTPPRDPSLLIPYMAVALVCYSTGYSLFNVPYLAMPAEIVRGSAEQLRLLSFRTAFIGIGQLAALALSAWLIRSAGGGLAGYRLMGAVMAGIVAAAMLATFVGTANARVHAAEGRRHRLGRADIATLLENRPLLILMGTKLCQYAAFGVLMPVNLLFLLNVTTVGYGGMVHLAVAQNLAVFVSMPIWTRIGLRLGKRGAYLLGIACLLPPVLSWLWADGQTGIAGLWWRGLLFGFGSAGALLMSTAILQDTIAYDRLKHGMERGGLFASFYAINEKLGFAAGAALVGTGLALGGFAASSGGQVIEQSASAIRSLYVVQSVVPAVLLGLAAALLRFYRLDDAMLANLRGQRDASRGTVHRSAGEQNPESRS